jgi:putative endonuclease
MCERTRGTPPLADVAIVRNVLIGVGRWLDRQRQAGRRRQGLAAHLQLAEQGEDWAQRFVQEMGWIVVARNYRRKGGRGEIDLVAVEGDTLVFVEVKTRSSAETGEPERAVHRAKEKLIGRTAEEYMRMATLEGMAVRFDVVSLVMGEKTKVEYLRDAFYPVRQPMLES